jgi:hypothetical protein
VKRIADNFDDTFVVIMGDALTNANVQKIVSFHKLRGALATIASMRVADTSQYGIAELGARHNVIGFQVQPDPEEAPSDLANTGSTCSSTYPKVRSSTLPKMSSPDCWRPGRTSRFLGEANCRPPRSNRTTMRDRMSSGNWEHHEVARGCVSLCPSWSRSYREPTSASIRCGASVYR